MFSILPFYVVLVFAFVVTITRHAQNNGRITRAEAACAYTLIFTLCAWTGLIVLMGIRDLHLELAGRIPFLWQAFVPVTLWMVAITISPTTRRSLHKIALGTPAHWFAWVQALRIGAIGGITKGIMGVIHSTYVFWVGIPDLLFGLSSLIIGWMLWRRSISPTALIAWNLLGFGLILFPTFAIMPYWMNEPGFRFIFEFPMILAPGIVVPTLISINLMQAWATWQRAATAEVLRVA